MGNRVIFEFVLEQRGRWPVGTICSELGVCRAARYAWRVRPASQAEQCRDLLAVVIGQVHDEVRRRYGSPRMHRELMVRGYERSLNTVAGIMREHGTRAAEKAGGGARPTPGTCSQWPKSAGAAVRAGGDR